MYALRRFSKLLKMKTIKDLRKRLRTHESLRQLVLQSEAKRKQAPQSEANVCRRRRQMQSRKKPPLLIAQGTQYCTESPTQISYLERNETVAGKSS